MYNKATFAVDSLFFLAKSYLILATRTIYYYSIKAKEYFISSVYKAYYHAYTTELFGALSIHITIDYILTMC